MLHALVHPRFRCPFFFFNDTATTEIYTLSLHDALPILKAASPALDSTNTRRRPSLSASAPDGSSADASPRLMPPSALADRDRKSTRLNSSHLVISYAVFCLKKKKMKYTNTSERSAMMTH